MPDQVIVTRLRDGTRLRIRPIRPSDRDRLQAGVQRLSPRSRYLRFHSPVSRLSPRQLDYLTDVDGHDHAAWIALDEDDPDSPGVGVARYVRLVDEPTVAEAAVTVADEYQGRGAGTVLLGVLSRTARENGIQRFRNYVLAENRNMLEVFDQLGAHRELEAPGLYRVDFAVAQDDDELPDTPGGRAFAAAAREELRLDRAEPPLWAAAAPAERGTVEGGLTPQVQVWLAAREQRADNDDDGAP